MTEKQQNTTQEEDFFTLLFEQGYMSRMDWFNYLNPRVKPGGVVFVGDSITQEFLVTDIYRDLNVHNRGIGGDTTEGLLKRLDESVFHLNPKTVFLMIGTNDFALLDTTPDKVARNIRIICQTIKDRIPEVQLVLESIYPTISPDFEEVTIEAMKARSNIVIDYVNKQLRAVADDLGIIYLDVNRHLKDENGQLKQEYTRDGLHLTTKGYEVVQALLKPYLEG